MVPSSDGSNYTAAVINNDTQYHDLERDTLMFQFKTQQLLPFCHFYTHIFMFTSVLMHGLVSVSDLINVLNFLIYAEFKEASGLLLGDLANL